MYQHTQHSPLHFLLYIPVAFAFVIAWQIRADVVPGIVTGVVGLILFVVALSFQTLTVTVKDEYLQVRYGPINLFGTRLAFGDITGVQTGKTSFIDGWGIHFIPFRGWTFNLWGFECVIVQKGDKTIRIGTDDSEKLADFIRSKLSLESESEIA